jgi:hypothetical protein
MIERLAARRLRHQPRCAAFEPSGRFEAMPSTVIRRFEYRPDRRELEIIFTTGRRYLYSDVPEEAAADFRAAFSKGVHFNRYIRDRYPCRELTQSD